MSTRSGVLIDDLHTRLAAEGHPDARPVHGFGLQAIGPDGATLTQVAARLGVTKQAAAKTVDALLAAGYAERPGSPRWRRSRSRGGSCGASWTGKGCPPPG